MNQPVFYSYPVVNQHSDKGPTNAATLSWQKGDDNPFVKELTQNSIDARASPDHPVEIHLRMFDVLKKDIPGFSDFENRLKAMRNYWSGRETDQYTVLFKNILKGLENDKINILAFEDYGTLGLNGDDVSDTFKYCVNDDNVSGKASGPRLGSFGIGKNAVFVYSLFQTVFYSSINPKGEYKFKGVSKLGSYKYEGKKCENRIYYGKKKRDAIELIDDLACIPEPFRRIGSGLSQYVLGALKDKGWKEDAKRSFLMNYWQLFERGELIVKIENEIINKSNFLEVARAEFSHEDFMRKSPLPFIEAYQRSKGDGVFISEKIENLGNVEVYLVEQQNDDLVFPNKIQYLRDGMRIKDKISRSNGLPRNIAGVLLCVDKAGNTILGAMEPHTHDEWKAQLIKNKNFKGKRIGVEEAKKIIKDIEGLRKKAIDKLREKYSTDKVESVPFLDQLFDGFKMGGSSGGDGNASTSSEGHRLRNKLRQVTMRMDSNGASELLEHEEGVKYGNGDGDGIGEGDGGAFPHESKGPKPKKRGGGGEAKEGKDYRSLEIYESRFVFCGTKEGMSEYQLFLDCGVDHDDAQIRIEQVGDGRNSRSSFSGHIRSAEQSEGRIRITKSVQNGETEAYILKGIRLSKKHKTRCRLLVEERVMGVYKVKEVK